MFRAIAVLLLAALVLVAPPAKARAGTYDVTLCADPANTGFTRHNDDENTLAAEAHCPADPD